MKFHQLTINKIIQLPKIYSCLILVLGVWGQALSAPSYATWTVDASGNSGTGAFSSQGSRTFNYTITGQHDPAGTSIDNNDIFDETTWETIFGQGDNQESLRFGRNSSSALTVSTVSIDFSSPVIASSLSFAVTDLEGEDAVISASLYGNSVSNANVTTWFNNLFDSKPATAGSPHLPSAFDSANAAVVAEFDADGILSNEIFGQAGTESPSAWFTANQFIDNLTITHRNRFGAAASMHIYMAVEDAPSFVSTTPTSGTSLVIPATGSNTVDFINSGTSVGLIKSCVLSRGAGLAITSPTTFPILIPANGTLTVTLTASMVSNDTLTCTYVDSAGSSNVTFAIQGPGPIIVPINQFWALSLLIGLLIIATLYRLQMTRK